VTSVGLLREDDSLLTRTAIPSFYAPEFSREEKDGVLFDVVVDVPADAGIKQQMTRDDWSRLRIALLDGDHVISTSASITVFSADTDNVTAAREPDSKPLPE
jgi:hypothetical protein